MNENTFDTSSNGPSELTDAELMQVQGGSFGSWLKKVAHVITHPLETLWAELKKKLPPLSSPFPSRI